jgi:three-Cys-motif partner protein
VRTSLKRQGQGVTTEHKQRTLGSVFTVSLSIAKQKNIAAYHYHHADLHSGSGFNDDAGCKGSPLVFLEAMRASGRRLFTADFIDNDHDKICLLERAVGEAFADYRDRVRFVASSNRDALDGFEARIRSLNRYPQYAMGSILIDPNGYLDDVPLERLRSFSARYPRIDIIHNVNLTYLRRAVAQRRLMPTSRWSEKDLRNPFDLPEVLNRRFVQIQERNSGRGHAFITLVMRSMQTHAHRDIGLFNLTSPRGQQIQADVDSMFCDRRTTIPVQQSLFGDALS